MIKIIKKLLAGNVPIKGYMQHYKPKVDDTVLDVGAYPGDFALKIANRDKTG